jgi:hypothetical protein
LLVRIPGSLPASDRLLSQAPFPFPRRQSRLPKRLRGVPTRIAKQRSLPGRPDRWTEVEGPPFAVVANECPGRKRDGAWTVSRKSRPPPSVAFVQGPVHSRGGEEAEPGSFSSCRSLRGRPFQARPAKSDPGGIPGASPEGVKTSPDRNPPHARLSSCRVLSPSGVINPDREISARPPERAAGRAPVPNSWGTAGQARLPERRSAGPEGKRADVAAKGSAEISPARRPTDSLPTSRGGSLRARGGDRSAAERIVLSQLGN